MSVLKGRRALVAATCLVTLGASLGGVGSFGFADATGAGPGPAAAGRTTPAPNVVLYILDDLGWADTGITNARHRNPRGSTPVLDRLAREGVAFTHATASPNCTPSRASLLTGTQATNANNRIYAVNGLNAGPGPKLLRGPHQGQPGQLRGREALPKRAVTIAETLQDNGYATGAFGKFHVARNRRQVVAWHGFDVSYGSSRQGNPGKYNAMAPGQFHRRTQGGLNEFAQPYTADYVAQHVKPFSHGVSSAGLARLVGKPKNVQDAMADATEKYIGEQSAAGSKPFFMHVGSYAVHTPVNPRQTRPDLGRKHGAFRARGKAQRIRRSYDAILEGADQTVARLVHALETTADPRNGGRPMAENTIVFFTSDNGGRVDKSANNGPFRGGKSTTLEGGVRVPWLVWSGNKSLVPAGAFRDQDINAADFYPTVVEATGARGANRGIDGVSWWPVVRHGQFNPLAGHSQARFARVLHMPGYLNTPHSSPVTTIRQGRWKATYFYETGRWALFDLRRDPGERRDVSRRRPRVLAHLARLTMEWARVHHPPLATVKRSGTRLVLRRFTGMSYTEAGTHRVRRKTVTVKRNQEAPLLVPRSFGKQRPFVVKRRGTKPRRHRN